MSGLVGAFANVIINPLLLLLFSVGLFVFVFGVVEFFFDVNVRGNQGSKEKGKQHMLWGVVGMFVMVAAVAIVNLIKNTVYGLTH